MFRGDAPLFLFLSFCGLLTACFLLLRFHLVPLVFFFLRLIGRYLLFQLLNIPFVVLDIRVRRGFFLFFLALFLLFFLTRLELILVNPCVR